MPEDPRELADRVEKEEVRRSYPKLVPIVCWIQGAASLQYFDLRTSAQVPAAHTGGNVLDSSKLLAIERPFKALRLLVVLLPRLLRLALTALTFGIRLIGCKHLLRLCIGRSRTGLRVLGGVAQGEYRRDSLLSNGCYKLL